MKRLGWFLLMVICSYTVIRVRFFYMAGLEVLAPTTPLGLIDVLVGFAISIALFLVAAHSFLMLFFDESLFGNISDLVDLLTNKEDATTSSEPN